MHRLRSILWVTLFSSTLLNAQSSYLDRPDLLAKADSCLTFTYNFSFEKARQYQQELERISPKHPAPPFLEAIIIYWENFPLNPDNPHSQLFLDLLSQSVDRAESMQENEDTRLEGVFFDLFGRAFRDMFWADNNKSGKVIPDLRTMYRHTKEGFELRHQFSEFYFSTGLYNYYVEAYPEAHPGFKPMVAFMHEGDRELGLEQLNHAIDSTSFVKVESLLFMTLIQLNYENDLETASVFAYRLYSSYPRNTYFQGLLVVILLHLNRFEQAGIVMRAAENQTDDYSKMLRIFTEAFTSEIKGEKALAEKKYKSTIELAEIIGPFADIYCAIGYMGLSRLEEKRGSHNEAKKYARKAANHTSYSFILDE